MKSKNQNNTEIMSKNVIACMMLLFSMVGFSQTTSESGMTVREVTKLENIAITVTVDSAEDLESNFKIENIKDVLDDSAENESISFKIICNGKKMSNGIKSHVSYKVDGNSNDLDTFIATVEKIRTAAIRYYNNKE